LTPVKPSFELTRTGIATSHRCHSADGQSNTRNHSRRIEAMNRLTEIITAIQHALHLTKPLLFELVLFIWAAVEMGRFIWTVALGGHGG
jgi:hypothetical protein